MGGYLRVRAILLIWDEAAVEVIAEERWRE